MYTLSELESKTFGELKKIGYEFNVLPKRDRRRRQSWIDALVNVNPPLLQLLEETPAASVEQVQEAIAQVAETSPGVEVESVQEVPLESKFGRIVYPKQAAKQIAQNEEARPHLDRTESADIHNWRSHPAKSVRDSSGVKTELRGSQEGDRVLAVARDCETGRGSVLPDQSIKLVNQAQEPIAQVAKVSTGAEVDRALSHKFLLCLKEGHNTLWYDGKNFVCEKWSAKAYCKRGVGSAKHQLRYHPEVKRLGNLQVVETSPGVDVDRPREPIMETVEDSPAASVEQVQEAIELQAQEAIAPAAENSPGVWVDLVQEPLSESSPGATTCPFCEATHGLFTTKDHLDRSVIRCLHCSYSRPKNYPGAIQTLAQESKSGRIFIPDPVQQPIAQATKKSPGVDSGVEVDPVEESIVSAKNFPGSRSKASIAHQLLELFQSRAHIIEDSPGVKTEATVSESAIAPFSAKNPILTGVIFSDRFLALYSPPQVQIIHFQSDADGQLSLLNFEIESLDEPPDPDDFESLDAFREALARWDWEHPSSFDHCSDLPNSVHSEPNSVHSELNSVHSEPLEVSLDSFCEWAPCPADWYEPTEAIEASKVMELSPVYKNSSTSAFFILTFNCLGDRFNRSDEPPDTGIFARLPKPKPPNFPPQVASQPQVRLSQQQVRLSQPPVNQASRSYPETIPKLFHRVAAGSSTQPARSPPGGDAMS